MAGQRLGMAGAAPRGVTRWSAWSSRYVVPRSAPVGWGRPSSRRCPHWRPRPDPSIWVRVFRTPTDPSRSSTQRSPAIRVGRQPVPAGTGHARAAGVRRLSPGAVHRADVRPRHRGARHHRSDRGDRGRTAGTRRPGRRGRRARALLRLVRREHRVRGRRPASGHSAAADVRARRRRAARSGHAADPGHPAQHPAQPHGRGAVAGGARAPSPRSPSTGTSSSSWTRSTST